MAWYWWVLIVIVAIAILDSPKVVYIEKKQPKNINKVGDKKIEAYFQDMANQQRNVKIKNKND